MQHDRLANVTDWARLAQQAGYQPGRSAEIVNVPLRTLERFFRARAQCSPQRLPERTPSVCGRSAPHRRHAPRRTRPTTGLPRPSPLPSPVPRLLRMHACWVPKALRDAPAATRRAGRPWTSPTRAARQPRTVRDLVAKLEAGGDHMTEAPQPSAGVILDTPRPGIGT